MGARGPLPRPSIRSAPSEEIVDLDALYRAHARTVARWAARLGGPAIDAEDVTQEVFLVARRRLSRFANHAKITTWLFRTTEKLVRNARRKLRWRRLLGMMPADLVSLGPTPVELLEQHELARQVYAVLDALPDRQRRVLVLFEMEGLSTPEIATLLAARQGTVRVWLHRARAAFVDEERRRGLTFSTRRLI
jgi:RNA polymerase sigma-70 factor (ECF subfamily)